MSRPIALALALSIGAAALLALWFVRVERGPAGRAGSEPDAHEPASTDPESLAPSPSSAPAPPAEEARDVPGPETEPAWRSELPDERPRISGRVVVPSGIPAGEQARVRAEVFLGRAKKAAAQKITAPVAADGSFALATPVGTRLATLSLDSRYLVLESPVEARPGDSNVLLSPTVCAMLAGRLLAPPGVTMPASGKSWTDVVVSFELASGTQIFGRPMRFRRLSDDGETRPDESGAFALARVPTGVELDLYATNPFGPEWTQHIEPLAPGETRELVVALDLGATIAGRVIDEHGVPVQGVEVSAEDPALSSRVSVFSMRRRSIPDSRTDVAGCFGFQNLARGSWMISVGGGDLARVFDVRADTSAGDVRDLVLSVVRGACIEGTVVWPDGSPARTFTISAIGASDQRSESGLSGSLRLCGLTDESYRIDVQAIGSDAVGTAHALGVRPGEKGLTFLLESIPAFELKGVVVDGDGAPIQEFGVRAAKLGADARSFSTGHTGGAFSILGLTAGEWKIQVSADGYRTAEQSIVIGASPPAALRFVLERGARIRGQVVDSAGKPVSGAIVDEHGLASALALRGPGEGDTDGEGRFSIEVGSASVRLQAAKQGYAPSEIVVLDPAPGALVEGVILRLRDACGLTGRVLDERGEPVISATVFVVDPFLPGTMTEADADGRFELSDLPPGRVRVAATREEREDAYAQAWVELVPAHACSVELRFAARDPVRVHGRITAQGRPIVCQFAFESDSFASSCASGADGRFEVTLQSPGAWNATIALGTEWPREPSSDVRVLEFSVPDADEHSLELEFSTLKVFEAPRR